VESGFCGGGLNVSPGGGERAGKGVDEVGEIKGGSCSFQEESGGVMSPRRHLRRGEGPEPYPGFLTRQPYLGHVTSPAALPHSAECSFRLTAALPGAASAFFTDAHHLNNKCSL